MGNETAWTVIVMKFIEHSAPTLVPGDKHRQTLEIECKINSQHFLFLPVTFEDLQQTLHRQTSLVQTTNQLQVAFLLIMFATKHMNCSSATILACIWYISTYTVVLLGRPVEKPLKGFTMRDYSIKHNAATICTTFIIARCVLSNALGENCAVMHHNAIESWGLYVLIDPFILRLPQEGLKKTLSWNVTKTVWVCFVQQCSIKIGTGPQLYFGVLHWMSCNWSTDTFLLPKTWSSRIISTWNNLWLRQDHCQANTALHGLTLSLHIFTTLIDDVCIRWPQHHDNFVFFPLCFYIPAQSNPLNCRVQASFGLSKISICNDSQGLQGW